MKTRKLYALFAKHAAYVEGAFVFNFTGWDGWVKRNWPTRTYVDWDATGGK